MKQPNIMLEDKDYYILKKLMEEKMEEFELKELIGLGSESHVYKSIIRKLKKPVTMKVIFKNKKHNKSLKEIEIGHKLKNKNDDGEVEEGIFVKAQNKIIFEVKDISLFDIRNTIKTNIDYTISRNFYIRNIDKYVLNGEYSFIIIIHHLSFIILNS